MAELGGTRPTSTAVDAIEIAVSGCVFLGKRSARLAKNTPDMPFGLSTLQILLDADKRGFLMGTRLSPDIAVNLRSDCPVVESGSAYYSPARVQLKPGDRVTLSEILPLNYLDDVFFWARVTARGSNSGSNDSNAGIDPSAAPADAGSLQIGERDVCGSALLGLLTVIGQRHAGVCPRPWPMHELG
ncbi:hypothetical protein XH83_36660 (plasmid) [Bradyrhizobium sp. CCBAU 53351]|nr:hypothetical protein X265_39350 [Bradyrhizobium guangdongense]QAU51152.1 hypothetical protein XH91_38550 [Bradyrhizobium guangzhouense]QOZ57068.1 hypothetical protein XH90_38150 [Bradyrhizobium sp. CCBAU 53338]QOZ81023.1 hypothetical protein XH83_36660 [Bradyrhizobium sp. CCBAU 53351]QOZ64186.1 hypothetical protein XH86_35765 [Bradyrhizobium guangdongense]